jgi:hypothetical protein
VYVNFPFFLVASVLYEYVRIFDIQGVLKMAYKIYVTRIYVEYQYKKFEFGNDNNDGNNNNDNPCYFLTLLKFEILFKCVSPLQSKQIFLLVLWRTINLGRPVIALTSKCEAGIMFN